MNGRWQVGRRMLLAGLVLLASGALRAQDTPRPVVEQPRVVTFDRMSPDQQIELLISRRARLGVSINFMAQETDSLGALVNGVSPNGPAARVGLRAGDIITRINGRPLVVDGIKVRRGQSAPGVRLSELASQLSAGDTVTVQYIRRRDRRTVTLVAGDEPALTWNGPDGTFGYVVGDSPEAAAEALRRGEEAMPRTYHLRIGPDTLTADSVISFGGVMAGPYMRTPLPPPMFMMLGTPLEHLELAPLNAELGRYFGSDRGVLVIRSPEESSLGLQGGDVILRVDGRITASPAHLLRMLRSYAPAETLRFEILRMKKKTIVKGTIGPR